MPRSLILALVAAALPLPLGMFLAFAWRSAPSAGLLVFVTWVYAPVAIALCCGGLVAWTLAGREVRRRQRGLSLSILGLLVASGLVTATLCAGPGSASSVVTVHLENFANQPLVDVVVETRSASRRLDRLGPGDSAEWPFVLYEGSALSLGARLERGPAVQGETLLDAESSHHVAFRIRPDGRVVVDDGGSGEGEELRE